MPVIVARADGLRRALRRAFPGAAAIQSAYAVTQNLTGPIGSVVRVTGARDWRWVGADRLARRYPNER